MSQPIPITLDNTSICWLVRAGLSHIEQTPLGETASGLTAIAALLESTPCAGKLRDLATSAQSVIAEARRTAIDMGAGTPS